VLDPTHLIYNHHHHPISSPREFTLVNAAEKSSARLQGNVRLDGEGTAPRRRPIARRNVNPVRAGAVNNACGNNLRARDIVEADYVAPVSTIHVTYDLTACSGMVDG
jgi:hypothetical protein